MGVILRYSKKRRWGKRLRMGRCWAQIGERLGQFRAVTAAALRKSCGWTLIIYSD